MATVVLSLGSNLGDRVANLRGGLRTLGSRLRRVSSVYETDPWGPVPQEDYLNIVALADDPDLDALGWLRLAQEAERGAGRVRDVRWGPRTLDVDLVALTEAGEPVTADAPELTLPHSRAYQRAFVLVPWLDVDPEAVLSGRRVADLVAGLSEEDLAAVRPTDLSLGL